MLKNPKGPTFPFSSHCETFFSKKKFHQSVLFQFYDVLQQWMLKDAKASTARQFGPTFWVFRYCRREYFDTLKSFLLFLSLRYGADLGWSRLAIPCPGVQTRGRSNYEPRQLASTRRTNTTYTVWFQNVEYGKPVFKKRKIQHELNKTKKSYQSNYFKIGKMNPLLEATASRRSGMLS